jgi:chemotaxis protein CheC
MAVAASVLDADRLQDLVANALKGSARAFGEMVCREVTIASPRVTTTDCTKLCKMSFQPEEIIVGIYLLATIDPNVHLLMLLSPADARFLSKALLGEDDGLSDSDELVDLVDLDDMDRSALGELGNVVTGFFSSFVGDMTGLPMFPSPPEVVTDMTSAILDAVLADVSIDDSEVLMIDTTISLEDQALKCQLLLMPDSRALRMIGERLVAR